MMHSTNESGDIFRSHLFYFGTNKEVEIGDKVLIKRWFRSPLEGVVCYIPGICPPHKQMQDDGDECWGIRVKDGLVYVMYYNPLVNQPKRNVVFVSRGSGGVLEPDDNLI